MNVTVYTDASYHLETGQAGCAFWCKSDMGRLSNRIQFDKPMLNPTHAEIQGILHAMKACLERWGSVLTTMNIYTDSRGAIQELRSPYLNPYRKWVYAQMRRFGFIPYYHWIKRESKPLNVWCDKNAPRGN